MTPQAASPLADIGLDCKVEDIFICLEKMKSGCTAPGNVITDINPYNFAPSNLPDGFWYLIRSDENAATEFGFWKVKGEACKLFSNNLITGWRTTLQFFEGQVPCEHRTDWMMQQYWVTRKALGENCREKEASSLCRVFLSSDKDLDCEMKKEIGKEIAYPLKASKTHIYSAQSVVPEANNDSIKGSTGKPEEDKDDETGNFAVTERPLSHLVENLIRSDFISSGDYLELRDLESPVSPSSSSDNSSCFTMSSDGYFDPEALLQEIESDRKQELAQRKQDCKLSVAESPRPNEVVILPASAATFTSIEGSQLPEEEILRPELPEEEIRRPELPLHEQQGKEILQHFNNQTQNYRDEGPSNSHHKSTTNTNPYLEGEKKAVAKFKRKKSRNKYFCFMPFHILF